MKKKPMLPGQSERKRILVIRAGAVGDLIMTLPVLRALRRRFPGAYIEVTGHPHSLALIAGQREIDAVSSINRREAAHLYIPDGPIPEALKRTFGAFDLIVAYVSETEGTLIENLRRTGAKRVIAWPPFPDRCTHEADHLLEALRPLGVASSENAPELVPTPLDRVFAARFWSTHNLRLDQRVLALHPGSGSPSKCWPPERFARIADWAIESFSAAVLLIAGPADEEARHQTLSRMKGTPVLASDFSLPRLAALLEQCTAFLGNDSGITHLAAAVGTPTVALFGPTNPRIWGPRGGHVKILHHETPCSPCDDRHRRRCSHRICMERIAISEVKEWLLFLMDPQT
ncbi:MAG: glycosyltransferase family 9 protein [Candidatus Latescibacteria bacterium]|nr:glycosyltransferase family 9 protein [Candidatus Latescibacterota bacterium]